MKRLNNSIVEDIKECNEKYNDGWNLISKLLAGDENTKCDEVDDKASDGHDDTNVSCTPQALCFNHD